jgi:hypothetical protein
MYFTLQRELIIILALWAAINKGAEPFPLLSLIVFR